MKGLAALTVIATVQTHAADVPAQQLKPSINPVPLEIPFASPNAAGVTVESAPSAWGGARSGSEPTLSDRVVDYKIHATLDPVAHTVSGQEKLTWRNRSDRPIRVIYLHLYLNALEIRAAPSSPRSSAAASIGATAVCRSARGSGDMSSCGRSPNLASLRRSPTYILTVDPIPTTR